MFFDILTFDHFWALEFSGLSALFFLGHVRQSGKKLLNFVRQP